MIYIYKNFIKKYLIITFYISYCIFIIELIYFIIFNKKIKTFYIYNVLINDF